MIQDIFPHKYSVGYKAAAPSNEDILLIFSGSNLLCSRDDNGIKFPTVAQIMSVAPNAVEVAQFLFTIDDVSYFHLPDFSIEAFGIWSYLPKDAFREIRPLVKAYAAVTALQIHLFYANNTYCGRCASKMNSSVHERAMVCPNCSRTVYPQICPSVIVGITDGDKILVTRYAQSHSKFRRYALVAGYNEVGETLEDTVRREVMEEVGIRVKNIRYFKSQPWSFTDSLLVGFFCEVDGSTRITLDTNELSEAVWLSREEIPDESADPTISLTGTMMYEFKHKYSCQDL